MEINGPQLPPQLTQTSSVDLVNWRNGQLLQALVIRAATYNQQALLQIGRQQFETQTTAPLQTGQRLTVEVIKADTTPPLLKLHTPIQAPDQTISNQLKITLPRQLPMPPLINNLNWLQQTPPQAIAHILPSTVIDALKTLRQQLPNREHIATAAGLKDALKNSGLFLEQKLVQSARPAPTPGSASTTTNTSQMLNGDLKTQLTRLLTSTQQEISRIENKPQGNERSLNALQARLATLRQLGSLLQRPPATTVRPLSVHALTPLFSSGPPLLPDINDNKQTQLRGPASRGTASPIATLAFQASVLMILKELARQTEGALARVRLNQLNALPTQEQPNPPLLFEVPIRHNETIRPISLRVEEEQRQQTGEEEHHQRHTVHLSLDLENLGPLHARVSLINEKILVTMWAERTETLTIISKHLHELHQRLREAGIQLDPIQCLQGTPPETTGKTTQRLTLNEKA